ncbi:MAG: enoyl-CoA hydratase/isomerase family protein [Deltaproteobacteria bacterium]|nr:enoyl-CoA hydratase/isomerase family protein [Nannocystaceae bacterium]
MRRSGGRPCYAKPVYTDLRYQTEGVLATITLDRPEARNAYSSEMVDSLVAALDAAERDDAIRAIVLTGAGKAFHAGGDLKQMQAASGMFAGDPVALRRQYIEGIQRVPRRLAQLDKPIVAAINGAAIGAGLDLACMCDLRVVARGAQLGSTFVKVGLVPGDGGAYFLARTIGFSRALELVLTGRLVDADEAAAIGLVHRVVEPDQLAHAARELALAVAANAPLAVRLTKRAAYRSWDLDLDTALELAATYQGVVQNTADHREAVAAILGKRPPAFTGR